MSHLVSSIIEISQQLKRGLITSSQLCEMCLTRIEYIQKLNAFITCTKDIAKLQAEAADKRIKEGKCLSVLDGVPISYKDNFNTRSVQTTCASKMLSNYIPPYNATVVQKLLDQGTVMMGKTNMDEFAMGSGTVDSLYGPTRNIWRSGLKYKLLKRPHSTYQTSSDNVITSPQRTLPNNDFFVCGGSSGGSAIAVMTGCCFGAIGSDTGGSTRNPAAMCGVVGLKPTYGLVSRYGLIPLCNSLDVPGILARTVDDVILLLGCVAGYDPKDSTTSRKEFRQFSIPKDICIKNLRIGIPKEYKCPGMTSEVERTWKDIADLLENAGAKVTEVSLPHTKYSIVCYSVLCCCDVASNFARYDGIEFGYRANVETSVEHLFAATRQDGFGSVVRERILAGNYFLLKSNYEKYYLKAAKVRQLICDDFQRVFQSGVDLLLTPVTLSDAVPYSEWKEISNREHSSIDDFCTQPVNMAGLPAVSIPIRLSKKGLPLSLQLIGMPFQEKTMLAAAKWIEQQVDFPVLSLDIEEDTS